MKNKSIIIDIILSFFVSFNNYANEIDKRIKINSLTLIYNSDTIRDFSV